MEGNLEFLFLSGFMRSVQSIKRVFPTFHEVLHHTLEGDSGLGRDLMDALEYLRGLPSQELVNLLPATLEAALDENYVWPHDGIQRALAQLLRESILRPDKDSRPTGQSDITINRHVDLSADTQKRCA